MRKIYLSLLAMLSILFIAPSQVLADGQIQPPTASSNNTHYLFVQTAKTAQLRAVPNQPGVYVLTLTKANPYITYFTDRPNRDSGLMTAAKFAQQWQMGNNSFSKNAPNADISAIQHKVNGLHVTPLNFPVELLKLSYNSNTGDFTYVIHALPQNAKTAATIPQTADLRYTALFIDSDRVCLGCIG